MGSKKKTLSRIGIASKGIVYVLIGVLTALAAFNQGGNKTSKKDALQFLAEQSYGRILLILIGIGLSGYLFYRFYQAVANLKNHDDDAKGYFMRASYFISGLVYGFLAFSAFKMSMGNSSNGSSYVTDILNSEYGNIIAILIAIALAGKSIYEFYKAYSGKYREEIEHTDIDASAQNMLIKSGKMGFTARGIVVAIMSFLFFKAGFQSNGEKVNRANAFNFLQDEFGSIVLGLVALGIALYGVFMLIKSKYPDVNLQ
ncbi:DUF1206 domain-containing protein [Psychroserpens mesophilus]|uniref:DUF1206 domain-containing protein n=1 Tax=Psychroserpens mesophilus TaxID=325473 RepID=UPI003D6502FB